MEDLFTGEPFFKSRTAPLPFINDPATDMDTVYTIVLEAYNWNSILLMFDQPLYAKSQEVKDRMRPSFDNVIIHLGSFHMFISFMGAIVL